ncbi:DUF1329 domain-containing protein [Undibacterium arcticum]
MLPERNKGEIIVGQESYNHKQNPRQAWQYNPGTRRVRQLPAFGFDMPQGAGGFRTVDDDRLFNGSPERYDWKNRRKEGTLYSLQWLPVRRPQHHVCRHPEDRSCESGLHAL